MKCFLKRTAADARQKGMALVGTKRSGNRDEVAQKSTPFAPM